MHCMQCGIDIPPTISGQVCSVCQRTYDKWNKAKIACIGIAVVIAGTFITILQDANRHAAGMVVSPASGTANNTSGAALRSQMQSSIASPSRVVSREDGNAAELSARLERMRAERPIPAHSGIATEPPVPTQSELVERPANLAPRQPEAQSSGPSIQLSPPVANAGPAWPHKTASGVRWDLRQGDRLILVVDLGGRVANIQVAPAFQNLNLTEMSIRVDWLRSVIAQSYFDQAGNYLFLRNGNLYRAQQ